MNVPDEWLAEASQFAPKLETVLLVQADIDNHPEWRGQYRPGLDKRGDVLAHEALCERQNCWMHRDPDGVPFYVSEVLSPAQVTALLPVIGAASAISASPTPSTQ